VLFDIQIRTAKVGRLCHEFKRRERMEKELGGKFYERNINLRRVTYYRLESRATQIGMQIPNFRHIGSFLPKYYIANTFA
jgi:hypothetical protein